MVTKSSKLKCAGIDLPCLVNTGSVLLPRNVSRKNELTDCMKRITSLVAGQRESFRAGYPVDVPASFVRTTRVKTSGITRTRGRP